jgi:hypothetical protein
VASPAAPSCAAAAAAPADGDLFTRLLERVRRDKGMLAGFLEHGRLLKAGGGVLEIGFSPQDGFFLDTARETENLTYLRAAARELLGGKVEVRLVTVEGEDPGPGAEEKPRETDRNRKLRHEALDNPALNWAVEILQAQVMDVKLDS